MVASIDDDDLNTRPYVSIVLPAFNAAELIANNVPTLLTYLRSLAVTHEVLVVDDGTHDSGQTRRTAEALGCRYLTLSHNRGKGAAVRTGMRAATGRYRIFTDADVPFEMATIGAMLRYLDFKEFHIVAGDRTLPESRYFTRVPLVRRLASDICSTIVGRFIAGGWFDTQCGIKGFQDHVAEDLFRVARVDRFAFDVELFYIALKRNYDIKRLPVELRSNDSSSVRVVTDGAAFARDLLRIRWNQLLGRYERQ